MSLRPGLNSSDPPEQPWEAGISDGLVWPKHYTSFWFNILKTKSKN